jgi:MoaA/NifB/PqqE/SkfB family radical SAM enzyme
MSQITESSNFTRQESFLTAAKMYRVTVKAYTLLPYYFARNGYAFPARHYYFEVTRRCNLRCVMCQYIDWLRSTPVSVQREGELTTEEWLRVINQVQRFSLVTFTGGEPFFRDDFVELLEQASARARTHIISNAVLLTEERARRCADLAPRKVGGAGLNFLGVSIDGPPEVHDRIRGMQGAFQRSMEGVRALVEFRKSGGKQCPVIHVTSVVQADNVDCLARMPQIVAEAGCDVLNLTLEARNWDQGRPQAAGLSSVASGPIVFPNVDHGRLTRALEETRREARRVGVELRLPDMPDRAIVRYYSGDMDLRAFRCGGAWTNLIVSAQGDAYPSCWFLRIGNVRENTLREIWNGPQARAFRKRTRAGLHPPCVGCCFLIHSPRK